MTKSLCIVLAVLMTAGPFLHPTPARAQGQIVPVAAPLLQPTVLHAESYGATDAQFASLQNLQRQAVETTLTDHDLSVNDAVAAQTWGRGDALAELWALIVGAINTPHCTIDQSPGDGCRTTDQQNTVDWLTAVAQRQAVKAAEGAGLEYVKWAGLSQSQYQSLLASNASKEDLASFLGQGFTSPRNYAAPVSTCPPNTTCRTFDGTTYSEGFCVYKPPAPFQSEYSDADNQTCFTPCTSIAGCKPFGPSYDQLVKWGAADVNNQLFNTPGFVQEVNNVAVGLGFGLGSAAVVAALSLIGIGIGTLAPCAAGAGATILFPFAATIGVTIAGIASLVLIAVAAAIVAAIYAVELFDAEAVPGQLATFIAGAATTPPDLPGMLGDAEKMRGLFSLFIGAALPAPRSGTCIFLDETGAPCLNAPDIPTASAQTDPQFKVQLNSGTASSPSLGDPSVSSTISWKDATNGTTTTARLSGNWFIAGVTSGGTTSTAQTLRIHYTDWNGNGQTAWLRQYPTQGYKFLSVLDQDPSGTPPTVATCLTDRTCAFTSMLQYVGTDGKLYAASVIPPPVPTVSANWTTNPVVEGSPAQFHAVATSPIGATISSYEWRFEEKTPNRVCVPSPCLSNPIGGENPQHTFQTSGSFQGRVTATDSTGKFATAIFTVPVSDVPPQLTFYATCTLGSLLLCFPPFNITTVTLGTATTLGGTIAHAGSDDTEGVNVDWGDGTQECNSNSIFSCGPGTRSPNVQVNADSPAAFLANHTYAKTGQYNVTVSVTDQSGATVSKGIIESVVIATATTLNSDLDSSVVGQAVTYTATVAPVPDGGTIAFSDGPTTFAGCDAKAIAADGTATCTAASAIAGSHTIGAVYSGNATYAPSGKTLTERVNPAATSTRINSSASPTVWGQPITLTATVSVNSPGAGSPAGTVTFKDGTADIGGCTAQPVETSTGKATCTTSGLSVAGHSMAAAYSGDSNFTGSSTAALAQTVNKAVTRTEVSSSKSPSIQGDSLTFTATVAATAPGAGAPTGTVTFKSGSTTLGTGSLSTNGGVTTATFTTSNLGAGTRSITAGYGGDGNFLPGAGGAFTQYVNTNLSDFPRLASGAYNLGGANLKGALFAGANLAGANFGDSNLTDVVFIGADLTGANLSKSHLKNADFTNANLTGANLTGATLKGATGLKTAILTNVVWAKTTCPDATVSDKNGGTCLGHL